MDRDLSLLEQWRAGDRQAGEDLFARHFKDVYRFFEHKVGAEADELVQSTFLACVAARDQFRGQSSFRTYLFAIARNELYAFLRRRCAGGEVDFEITSIAAIATSPSGRVVKAQERAQLRQALQSLPAEQQLLLELHYWHEFDASGLSEILGAAPGAIRVRLLRARRALRDLMTGMFPGVAPDSGGDRLAASLHGAELDREPEVSDLSEP